ncbi:LamG-like jellyroll fold domain-containing protein [Georgenia faecalis]|uniref:LamG-like jellyroll fold domain-containing protein n=2 Tax=Georgenia faecalis TaxID=2483799 RepID=A0ABV9DCL2_9MICO|nr:LamG-like jellyroll fold domain-containing protein [Georgenia faecalis]
MHSMTRSDHRGRSRRLIAGVASLALLTLGAMAPAAARTAEAAAPAGAAAPTAVAAAAPDDGLVAEYLFTQQAGATVPNTVSGPGAVGDARVVNGSDALWTGDSLRFTGGAKTSPTASWVELPDNLLAGERSATITTEVSIAASMKNTFNFLWNIGNDANQAYYFVSVRDTPRTAITTSSGGGEVNARAGAGLDAGRWYSLTSVIDGEAGTISFYVDGVRVASAPTTLTPASITDQSLNTIGRSPWPDPMFAGEVSTFRVYDRALSADEVRDVSEADALLHEESFAAAARAVLDDVAPVTVSDSTTVLPDYDGVVRWASASEGLVVAADGRTLTAVQPAPGEPAAQGTLVATATVRGATASAEVPVTIEPVAAADDAYGYLLVHFIEDSAGYAEKIYLDVSRGDNPEQWDPLNGGEPILASHLGTTGVRDPFLTYNPETGTYYIIATDLRVFGGDRGSGSCMEWCYWSSQGSTMLNVWESTDLVTWSDVRQIDLGVGAAPEMGMAWAPEATWVEDYDGEGEGAFVFYWSSNVYPDQAHTGTSYSRVLWGATTDFTEETYAYGGVLIDDGGNTIDTTVVQDEGTTYRITKDNAAGRGIFMESTADARWWEAGTDWTTIQTRIGAEWAGGNAGGVEGPAVFKSNDSDRWYLYVDVIPTVGYRPMVTTDLDAGWELLTSPDFFMAPSTKHGGVVSLTKAQYDTVRAADAVSAVVEDLGTVTVEEGATADDLTAALPATAEVTLAYQRGTADLPVDWDTATVDLTTAGEYQVTGTVRSIGANLNQWVGAGGSTAWNAPDRVPYSSTAITVRASVTVVGVPDEGLDVTATVGARCVAGKTVQVVTVTNGEDVPVAVGATSPYGTRETAALAPGRSVSYAFTTRQVGVEGGSVEVTAEATRDGDVVTDSLSVSYAASTCR